MTSGYVLHPEAFADLDEIREYIARDNPDAADRVLDELFAAFRSLTHFPHRGFKRPELTARALRFTLVRDYLIAFVPDEKPLWVVAVIHSRRNPRVIASVLRSRE